jgi:thiol:disulfide interchange protein
MLLRVVSGQGTAFAFVLVALAFLGLFQLGWRAAVSLAPRARSWSRSRSGPRSRSRAGTPG